ncbi:hypothetical protein ACHAXH_002934 [Discostella pseudostelligera]
MTVPSRPFTTTTSSILVSSLFNSKDNNAGSENPSTTATTATTTTASTSSAMPFFAAASTFSSSASSTSTTTTTTTTTATVTHRLPLGTIFDGRDYIFVTESNVRTYEWTIRECDLLFEDLMDAASLSLLDGVSTATTTTTTNNVVAPITDYELSQIVIVTTSDWDSNAYGIGSRYDVHDGQQRLVTLNLLLASLRDSFLVEANELHRGGNGGMMGGGKRAVALFATAQEIAGMLMPTKVRKLDSLLLSNLSPANSRIFHNFVHLSRRLSTLSTRERLRLLDYIVERVHLLVCVPETSRIARNIVLNQQGRRKGMDNEPIDDFKGLVCFRYTLEEEDMYRTFDAWDVLAADGSIATATAASVNGEDDEDTAMTTTSRIVKSVGREILSSACLLRASAALRTKIRSSRDRGGGDEVYELERWLRNELMVRNNQRSSSLITTRVEEKDKMNELPEHWQGKDFFVEEIEPASLALYKFRAGLWDGFGFLSKTTTKKEDSSNLMTKKQRDTTIARLNFLRDLTLGVSAANEAEVVVLEYLLRAEHDFKTRVGNDDDDNNSGHTNNRMLSRNLDEILQLIEKWTLWMAVTRPSSLQRQSRIFSLLDAMDDLDSVGGFGLLTKSSTAARMGTSLREGMNEYEFGASAAGKRLAVAILKRLNSHLMIEEKKNIPDCTGDAPKVEPILSEWSSEEERDEWAHRIGNMALVSSSATSSRNSRAKKSSDLMWEAKSKRYKKEPWVMTRQLADSEQWDVNSIQDQQKDILSLMDLVWSLE